MSIKWSGATQWRHSSLYLDTLVIVQVDEIANEFVGLLEDSNFGW